MLWDKWDLVGWYFAHLGIVSVCCGTFFLFPHSMSLFKSAWRKKKRKYANKSKMNDFFTNTNFSVDSVLADRHEQSISLTSTMHAKPEWSSTHSCIRTAMLASLHIYYMLFITYNMHSSLLYFDTLQPFRNDAPHMQRKGCWKCVWAAFLLKYPIMIHEAS